MERSLAPRSENCKVLGMGVAVRVRVSILLLIWRIFSLEETPNFCSSSMMSNPRSLKSTFLLRMRWVPMRMSTLPAWSSSNMRDISLVLRRRLIYSTLQGKSFRREEKVWSVSYTHLIPPNHAPPPNAIPKSSEPD